MLSVHVFRVDDTVCSDARLLDNGIYTETRLDSAPAAKMPSGAGNSPNAAMDPGTPATINLRCPTTARQQLALVHVSQRTLATCHHSQWLRCLDARG